MRILKVLLVAVLVASSSVAIAHKDRLLPIAPNGAIAVIPVEYGPAQLKVDFSPSKDHGPPIRSVVLSLGAKKTRLPACVTGLLLSRKATDIQASGSWHHDESRGPYYINILFLDPGHNSDSWTNPGYSMLFNLRTGKLMAMQVQIVRDNGKSLQYVPVDLAARCPSSVLKEVLDAPRT
ncbi:MAG: hypothetical protein HOQ32_02095 [Lysobacter sp.]|nr:hypothetical protein [Lysobacter sp.]